MPNIQPLPYVAALLTVLAIGTAEAQQPPTAQSTAPTANASGPQPSSEAVPTLTELQRAKLEIQTLRFEYLQRSIELYTLQARMAQEEYARQVEALEKEHPGWRFNAQRQTFEKKPTVNTPESSTP